MCVQSYHPILGRRLSVFAGSLVCLLLLALPAQAQIVADSFDDWSIDGIQGDLGWYNGYYNLTVDEQEGDGVYGVDDFIEFLNDDSGIVDPDGLNQWNGNQYLLYRDTDPNTGPWTRIAQENSHPNGTNSAVPPSVPGSQQEEHWTIRRWVAESVAEPTDLTLQWHLRAQNTGGGGGTGGILFLNGDQLDSAVIGGVDAEGVTRYVRTTINPGDIVDLALTPENLDGSRGDGSDGSAYRLTVDTAEPPPQPEPPPPPIADSVADFSGVQGQGNWYYGYYDLRDDLDNRDGVYQPDDFTEFLNDGSGVVSDDPDFGGWKDSPNHWDGGKWDLLNNGAPGANHGPWTEVTAGGGHPAANAQGDEEVHWNIRRWVSQANGEIQIVGDYSNGNAGGDGTTGRIFVDGEEVWSELSDGDTIDIDFKVPVTMGALVDFATDPDGSEVYDPADPFSIDDIADGNDGTTFRVAISALTSPTALQAGDADMNLEFNQLDLVQVLSANKYLTGEAASWGEGDWDGAPGGVPGDPPPGNGLFDQQDIIAALAADTYLKGPYAPQPENGGAMFAAIVAGGGPKDEQTSIVYNAKTGEVGVDAPTGTNLTSINIDSASGIFVNHESAENLDGSFDTHGEDNIFMATFGSSFGSLSFGAVAQTALTEEFVANDLSAIGSLEGGGGLGDVDLIYIPIPEPSSVVLLCLGLVGAGLLHGRRRRS